MQDPNLLNNSDTVKINSSSNEKELDKDYDKLFDRNYSRLLSSKVAHYIDKMWFRSELIGWENIPKRNNPERPLIYFTNHSGMAFPWDAMVFAYRFNNARNFEKGMLRAFSSPMLSQSALMNPFTIDGLWNRMGSVDASFENFENLMSNKYEDLLIYPEGIPGIAKGFNKKYQMQEMKTSFLRMSIKYKTDIVPFFCVNGEYINPYSYSSKIVNKIFKLVGIPFFPLGAISPLIVIQPWLFYFGFPAKLKYVLGERIKPYEMVDKNYDDISQDEFKELSERIRGEFQVQMNEAVKKHGKNPWDLKGLIKNMFKNIKLLPYGMPWSWGLLFYEFERKYKKYGDAYFTVKMGFFRNLWNLLKNPFVFFYFIPILGLIPIAIKGYKNHSLSENKKTASK